MNSKHAINKVQHTIAQPIELSGVGLHSGDHVSMRLLPAAINSGIVFRRVDMQPAVEIHAHTTNVVVSMLCSTLEQSGVKVATVEHVMSALAGLAIDNVYIEVSAPELPIMDGSAAPFVQAILAAGVTPQVAARKFLKIIKPIEVQDGDKYARLLPAIDNELALNFDFEINFAHPAFLGVVSHKRFELTPDYFMQEIGSARTFCFKQDVDAMQARGLALGGSLDNAVVLNEMGVQNPEGLRFADEMLRHKILDAVGDLYLIGYPIVGVFSAYKTGHALNNSLLHAVMADQSAYEVVTRYINV